MVINIVARYDIRKRARPEMFAEILLTESPQGGDLNRRRHLVQLVESLSEVFDLTEPDHGRIRVVWSEQEAVAVGKFDQNEAGYVQLEVTVMPEAELSCGHDDRTLDEVLQAVRDWFGGIVSAASSPPEFRVWLMPTPLAHG